VLTQQYKESPVSDSGLNDENLVIADNSSTDCASIPGFRWNQLRDSIRMPVQVFRLSRQGLFK
jgi:hypothetical protein